MTARALCLARPPAAAAHRRRGAGAGSRRRVVPASSSPSPASASDDASAFDLPPCVATVTRVDASGRRREFYVVGTVHTPGSASAEEVRAVIERVRPDAVVLELDQERLDALVDTALHASSTTPAGSGSSPGGGGGGDPARDDDDLPSLPYALASPTGYGADFLSGFAAAEAAGAVVVLGDAKARSLPDAIRANLFARPAALLDAPRLWRSFAYVLEALGAFDPEPAQTPSAPSSAAATVTRVRFADALASDPGKLAPLRGPAVVAAAALLADLASYASGGGGGNYYSVEAVAAGAMMGSPMGSPLGGSVGTGSAGWAAFFSPSSAFGFFSVFAGLFGALAFGRSAEVLLRDRDDVLADAAARASVMAAGLRRGDLVRVAHGFDADADVTRRRAKAAAAANAAERSFGEGVGDDEASSTAWPCFTLRRPLAAGEIRRLNLFEPRWLAMMDRLAEANGGDLVGAELACSLGVNRRYVRRDWDYWADAGGGGRRRRPTDPTDPTRGSPPRVGLGRRISSSSLRFGARGSFGSRRGGAKSPARGSSRCGSKAPRRRRRRRRARRGGVCGEETTTRGDPKNCASARTPRGTSRRAFSPRTRTPRGIPIPVGVPRRISSGGGAKRRRRRTTPPCGACALSGSRTVTASPRGSRERISTRGVKDAPSASTRHAVASCSVARLESVHY